MSTPKLPTQEHLFDSPEELHFSYWLDELKSEGFIIEWYRDITPYQMTSGLKHSYTVTENLKTKTKTTDKQQIILRPSEYTPDFRIIWSDTADNIFFQTFDHKGKITAPFIASVYEGVPISIVEVKPDFDRDNMTRLFILNQKFVWDKYKEYINQVEVKGLFEKTFTPYEYRLTPVQRKERKLGWTPISLLDYYNAKTTTR
jgi:hypothetical protein